MPLQFVLGPSGSGKTRYLYDTIIRKSQENPDKTYMVLVPEQYTMQTQREIIRLHPRHGMMNIDVLSFNRLAYRIFEEQSITPLKVLDDMGKSMILRRVAAEHKKELHYYRQHLNQMGFAGQLKSLLSELDQYGITNEMLKDLEAGDAPVILKEKLKDFTVILNGFRAYIEERFITAENLLNLCCQALPDSKRMKNSELFLDGFTGFTPVQYRILELCLGLCVKVTASASVDLREPYYRKPGKEELFYMSRTMICRLIDAASQAGTAHEEDVVLGAQPPVRFKDCPQLALLERNFGRKKPETASVEEGKEAASGILLCTAANPAEEVALLCKSIRSEIREHGLRYRDLAVITGDLASYGREIRKAFEQAGIPFFMDDKASILANPFVELIRSALEILRLDFPYESVFRFLKTGLVLPEERSVQETADRAENYVRALGIRGFKRFSGLWERQYRGGETLNLEELNAFRETILAPFLPLRDSFKEKDNLAADLCTALKTFLETLNLEEKLEKRAEALLAAGDSEKAKEYSQVYGLTLELLDRLGALLGEEKLSVREFSDILDAGFSEIQVGTIPATIDQVMVGDITRTRLDQVKVLFFLGVNEGIVPQRKENRGLLTDEERGFFAAHDLELAPSAKENGLRQQFYLYLMMTKPANRLVITWSALSGSGKELRPSTLIADLRRLFPELKPGSADTLIGQPCWKREGIRVLAEDLRERKPEARELLSYLNQDPKCQEEIRALVDAAYYVYREKGIGRAAAKALYGNLLQGSVTRLEQFAGCAYAHFLQYGLELMERQEYELGAVDMGNLFHNSLEQCFTTLSEQGRALQSLSDSERRRLVSDTVTRVTEEYGNTILHSSSRNAYLIRRITRIADRTMWALSEQLKKGSFRPVGFEVAFSAADNLKAMKIALSEEEALYLRGRIDRLDLCEDEEHVYVKIIDYKTGSTSFDLAALYYGLQLQLVVYMDAAMEMEERLYPDRQVLPAGMYYYRIQDPFIEKKGEVSPELIEAQIKKELRMNGLANNQPEALALQDSSLNPERTDTVESDVIPVELKNGSVQMKRSSTTNTRGFEVLRSYVRETCRRTGQQILKGESRPIPYKQGTKTGCDYCPYHAVCGFDKKVAGFGYRRLKKLSDQEVFEAIDPEEEKQETAAQKQTGREE